MNKSEKGEKYRKAEQDAEEEYKGEKQKVLSPSVQKFILVNTLLWECLVVLNAFIRLHITALHFSSPPPHHTAPTFHPLSALFLSLSIGSNKASIYKQTLNYTNFYDLSKEPSKV